MKHLLLFLFILFVNVTYSQILPDKIEVFISGRVDTTNSDVNSIYNLFTNYIQTRPDSIRYNENWNEYEQTLGHKGNVALFYTPFYNLGADPQTIFSIWKPFILAIEPNGKGIYQLRVALVKSEELPDKFLTILNLSAIQENGKWVLQNSILHYEQDWNRKQFKYITYVFPPNYDFNEKLAKKSISHCDSIASLLGISSVDTFKYFMCNNADQMGKLFGYEFYYLNYTTGLTIKWRKEIFSSNNSEYYPHEFMHMIFNEVNNDSIGYLIEEGLASFLGEWKTEKYNSQIKRLANDYLQNKPTYTFDKLLNNTCTWNGYQTEYSTGSVLTEIVFERSGYLGLKMLLESNTITGYDIINSIMKITKLKKKEIELLFKKKLMAYYHS